jgi:hypothetical protein
LPQSRLTRPACNQSLTGYASEDLDEDDIRHPEEDDLGAGPRRLDLAGDELDVAGQPSRLFGSIDHDRRSSRHNRSLVGKARCTRAFRLPKASGALDRPEAGDIHRIVQDAQNLNAILSDVYPVQGEMAGRAAWLADVKDPGFGRQAFSMMPKMGIVLEPRARFSDKCSVAWDLYRSELCSISAGLLRPRTRP